MLTCARPCSKPWLHSVSQRPGDTGTALPMWHRWVGLGRQHSCLAPNTQYGFPFVPDLFPMGSAVLWRLGTEQRDWQPVCAWPGWPVGRARRAQGLLTATHCCCFLLPWAHAHCHMGAFSFSAPHSWDPRAQPLRVCVPAHIPAPQRPFLGCSLRRAALPSSSPACAQHILLSSSCSLLPATLQGGP